MTYQDAQIELMGKIPKVSFTALSIETAAVLGVAYILVQILV